MKETKVVIMGAEGRNFYNVYVFFKYNEKI
jgi:hypothetical protein